MMYFIHRLLLLIGIVCLALYGLFTVQAHMEQARLEEELYKPRPAPVATRPPITRGELHEGDLFGRIEIPRLSMSVMAMEGISSRTLRLGAGHIPGTGLAFAGHRDSFFRPLEKVKMDDTIRFTTLEGTIEYRVISTRVVSPHDVEVLEPSSTDEVLTLVTCYPFYYIGPAPKRFIVQAKKD